MRTICRPQYYKTISHRLNAKDVRLLYSLNGHTEELVEAAKVCQQNEVPIVLVTAPMVRVL